MGPECPHLLLGEHAIPGVLGRWFFDPFDRVVLDMVLGLSPLEHSGKKRLHAVGGYWGVALHDRIQQRLHIVPCDRSGRPGSPRFFHIFIELTLVFLPRPFLPLGVLLQVKIGQFTYGQHLGVGLPTGRLVSEAALMLMLRILAFGQEGQAFLVLGPGVGELHLGVFPPRQGPTDFALRTIRVGDEVRAYPLLAAGRVHPEPEPSPVPEFIPFVRRFRVSDRRIGEFSSHAPCRRMEREKVL